jgi:hypothetical protein
MFFILLICGLLSCPVPTHAQSQPQNPLSGKNVLTLHSYEANMLLNARKIASGKSGRALILLAIAEVTEKRA